MEDFISIVERFGLATGILTVFAIAVWRVIKWIGKFLEKQIVPIVKDLVHTHKAFLENLRKDLDDNRADHLRNKQEHQMIIRSLDNIMEKQMMPEVRDSLK